MCIIIAIFYLILLSFFAVLFILLDCSKLVDQCAKLFRPQEYCIPVKDKPIIIYLPPQALNFDVFMPLLHFIYLFLDGRSNIPYFSSSPKTIFC